MSTAPARPPIHLLAEEADLVAELAMCVEHRQPAVARMLLAEIERAEVYAPGEMPPGYVRLNSRVTFKDERSGRLRDVQLVLPAEANIVEGRVSILTPMGAALYGLGAGQSIDWPDIQGKPRAIRIVRTEAPDSDNN